MAKSNIPTRLYYVEITTTFDRPELRGPGYFSAPPPAHSSFHMRFARRTLSEAVAEYTDMISGGWDFACEYASEVEIYSTDLDGYRPRCERKKVYRVRDAGAEKARHLLDRARAVRAAHGGQGPKERSMNIEGVPYYKFHVTFRLADGTRRRWIRWSPGWPWVYESVGRELFATFGLSGIKEKSCRIEAA
jgi:hypothetical protein